MRIANNRPLKELQAEFRSEFPYLDLYFFKKNTVEPVNELFEPEVKVGDVRDDGISGDVLLNGNLSAAAVEQTLAEIFGLKMKISYCNGFRGRYLPNNRPLTELNYRSMHMTEDVVIV